MAECHFKTIQHLKWVALAFKLSVLKKTRILTPKTCEYVLMMLFYSETKKIKYFLAPPPYKVNFYLIIVFFSLPYFSIYDILYTKENMYMKFQRKGHSLNENEMT